MKTYLVRCGYQEARAFLLVLAGDPAEATSKVKRMPLFRSLSMHVDQVIDSSLMWSYLRDGADRRLREVSLP